MTIGEQVSASRATTPYIERLVIRGYRGLEELTVELEPSLTVLAGPNNAGKSRIISALQLALGGRIADVDDFTVGELYEPEIDVIVAPSPPVGHLEDNVFDESISALFPEQIQVLVDEPTIERIAWRTTVTRSGEGLGARSEAHFLTFDAGAQDWIALANPASVTVRQRRAFAVDLINTGRDLRDELGRQGSSIRRILSDLEVPTDKREPLETELIELSRRIVAESGTLKSVGDELTRLHALVGSVGAPALNPLPGSLEELGRLISIDLNTGAGSLPIRFHGSGSRSLSSLQVQGVLYDRRLGKDGSAVAPTPVTLVEEPEAHLHPQAAMELPELLKNLRGQKVVSTHSAHLVTAVDPSAIRLVQVGRDGVRIVDLGPAATDKEATHRAFRPKLHTQAMEKIKRLVERPFGELLFSSSVVLGDGATERAFLPIVLRHALGYKSHGVTVVDPGSLNGDLAKAVVTFASMTQMPCFVFADSDPEGQMAIRALEDLKSTRPLSVVWINGQDDEGNPRAGAIEDMLLTFDEEMCVAACSAIRPDLRGSAKDMMSSLKGASGAELSRELITRYPKVSDWPASLRSLIYELEKVV